MKLAILSAMFLATTLATAQKNAPSKAECQADAIAWSVAPDGIQALQDGPMSITEIDARAMVLTELHGGLEPLQESNYSVFWATFTNALLTFGSYTSLNGIPRLRRNFSRMTQQDCVKQ